MKYGHGKRAASYASAVEATAGPKGNSVVVIDVLVNGGNEFGNAGEHAAA
jgi:hypothetical protein